MDEYKANELNTDERQTSEEGEKAEVSNKSGDNEFAAPKVEPINASINEAVKIAEGISEKMIGEKAEAFNKVGNVTADRVNFAKELIEINLDLDREKLRHFQYEDCTQVDLSWDEDLKIYEFDEEFITESVNTWLNTRLLVLTGEPNTGKTVAARRLCRKLEEITLEQEKRQQTNTVRPLKTNVKLNLSELAKNTKQYGGKTLIFENVFAGGNLDLNHFFSNLDNLKLAEITAALRKNEMFFIFTTIPEKIASCRQNLQMINVLAVYESLSKEKLKKYFNDKSAAFVVDEEEEKVSEALTRDAKELDKLFETHQMPRVVQFIKLYWKSVVKGEITARKSLERLERLDGWFLNELAEQSEDETSEESIYLNFETWCFVLTLTLTQCARETLDSSSPYEGVSLIYFEKFREKITEQLMKKTGFSRPEKITPNNYISEQNWLDKGRAEIYEDAYLSIDMIRFKDESYPEQMWEVLLKSARRTLLMLIPTLEVLAAEDNPGVRSLAAKILGRIGEIAIDEIVLRIFRKWIKTSKPRQMATVGYLYEGILFSGNRNYREKCLLFLKNVHTDFTSGSDGIGRGIWTAIAAYKQIGKYKLSEAMNQLREISEFALTGQIDLEKHIAQLPSEISKDIETRIKEADPNLTEEDFKNVGYQMSRASMEKEVWKVFRSKLIEMYQTNKYYNVFNYTLVSLCINVSPLKVFDELQKWFNFGNDELKMFIALNFLREEGIAENLEVQVDSSAVSDDNESVRIDLIVDEMTFSERSVEKMTRFLEDVFCGFDIFQSSLVRSYYRERFFQLLKRWAKESLKSEKHQETIINLFAALLLNSLIRELVNGLNRFIKNDAEFSDEENPLYHFRQKVFEKIISV